MSTSDPPEHARIATLRAAIATLEAAIASLSVTSPARASDFEAALSALRSELSALEAVGDTLPTPAPVLTPVLQVDQSGQSGGSSGGAGNTFGDNTHIGDAIGPQIGSLKAERDIFVATNQTIHYGADVAPLLRTYLAELSSSCGRLSFADAASIDPKQAALDLQAVYVGLEIERQVPLPPDDPAQQRERAIEVIKGWGFAGLEAYADAYRVTTERALQHVVRQFTPREAQRHLRALEALAAQPRLVITGHPGSGKSSLVNFMSLALAQACRGDLSSLARLGDDWPHGALLPIRVVLREFASWLETSSASPSDETGILSLFWRWLEQSSGMAELLVQHLRSAWAEGQVLLFLDGLDEVPLGKAGQTLRRLMAILEALGRGRSRIVVTCRVLDYQQAERRLVDWPVETIAPLAQPLREQLITHWFTALDQFKRPTRGSPAVLRDEIIRAIQSRSELRRLAGNPLLLTMMIQLQAYDGELPGDQVTLYQRSVNLLLHQWRRDAAGRVALGELLELPQWSERQLNHLLDRLAYVAHERGVSGDGEQGTDLPRQILLETAARFFAPYDSDRDHERAQKFLNYISAHSNGIIQRHDQQIYRFPHRTFQEYLAGRRLISDEDWSPNLSEFVDRALASSRYGPQWRGAILLAVSQHALEGRLRPVYNLAEELLARYRHDHGVRDLLLAAEVVQELECERLAKDRPGLLQTVRTELTLLLQDRAAQQRPQVAVAERGRAGFLLGALGDPRMPVTRTQWQAELAQLATPESPGYFCRISPGTYWIGSPTNDPEANDVEHPQHRVTLTHAYWIARLPITNTQWQSWVAQGGTVSYYANDTDLNQPNQPVVGIDWHAANAYCLWLSTELADILPPGYGIRLPTEVEWEVAARGAAARRYPWGNDWRDDAAATEEDRDVRGWQWTMPVGCYPSGSTPDGLLDMAGNVWEWTLSRWRSYPGADRPFTDENLVVVRGGGYNSRRTSVRCGARVGNHPCDRRGVNLGLRVVVSPLARSDVLVS